MTPSNPYRVLVVCMGNICRSPMAEAVLRHHVTAAGLSVVVDSAGTGGWHEGEPAHPNTMSMLRQHGYDLEHSARQIRKEWFTDRHLVLAMDQQNHRALHNIAGSEFAHKVRMYRSFDPALNHLDMWDDELNVPDPYYGTIEDYQEVLTMIESATRGLVTYLQGISS